MGCPKLHEGWRFVSAEPADVGKSPFLFSPEYLDSEAGLVYYGYRYYDADMGRWLNRDPKDESGFIVLTGMEKTGGFEPLYVMVGNDAINGWDLLGLLGDTEYEYTDCTKQQQATIMHATSFAIIYARDANNHLKKINSNKISTATLRYKAWYGCPEKERIDTVKEYWQEIQESLENDDMEFVCTNNSYYAAVIPGWGIKIWIGSPFWTRPLTGTNSQAGTLIHEIAHEVGGIFRGIIDYKYGPQPCIDLASSEPEKAIRNTDNYEFFVEIK